MRWRLRWRARVRSGVHCNSCPRADLDEGQDEQIVIQHTISLVQLRWALLSRRRHAIQPCMPCMQAYHALHITQA